MTYVIAELGVNWRSLAELDAMIGEAAQAGVDAIKVQVYKPDFKPAVYYHVHGMKNGQWVDNVMALASGHPRAQELNNIALKEEDIRFIFYRCQHYGIDFIATPFYPEAVEMLEPYVDIYKIRFADRNNVELIKRCLDTDKMILMSDNELPEVRNEQILNLYCVPEYPPKTDWNIVNLVKGFDGFSSHFPNWETPWYVIKQNPDLEFLEVHVRRDCYGDCAYEPIDVRVSITMSELKELCEALK
jgi:sialic acid synthase SpsE